eukprot:g24898.t1
MTTDDPRDHDDIQSWVLRHTVQGAPRQAAPCRHGRQRGAAVDFEGDWYDEGGVWVGEITPSEILFADGESRPWRLKDRQLHCGRLKVHPGLLQAYRSRLLAGHILAGHKVVLIWSPQLGACGPSWAAKSTDALEVEEVQNHAESKT